MRIPLTFGHTTKWSSNVNQGQCINMFPVVNSSDSKNQLTLSSAPGLERWVQLKPGQVRGMYGVRETIYAVSDNTFYSVNTLSGASTLIGTISSNTDKIWMGYNYTNQQLIIGDDANGWVYEDSALTAIADVDFPGCSSLATIDEYGIVTVPNTSQVNISSLYDFTAWDGTDYVNAGGHPDDVKSVLADHREAWFFGEKSVEVFRNVGDADAPFQRIDGTFQEVGTNASASPASGDNVIFWLDDTLQVRMAQGYASRIISTPAISKIISSLSRTDDAIGVTYTQDGHTFYVLIFPSADMTIAYDVGQSVKAQQDLWHIKSSGVAEKRWRGNSVLDHNGVVYVGDYNNGRIYKLKRDVYNDNTEAVRKVFTSQEVFDPEERRELFHYELEIEIEAGVGLTASTQGDDPMIMMQYSDDGGHTWSYESWRSMGKIGAYTGRARWYGLGASRNRVYKFAITDPIKIEAVSAYLKAKAGTE